jgi:hypothetical protein
MSKTLDLTQTGRYARVGSTDMHKRLPKTEERIDVIVRDEETHQFSTFDIPKNSDVVFDLGEDKHLRAHKVHVRIERGPDGTVGLSVRSTLAGLTMRAETGNAVYLTTLRGDLMPPKIEVEEEDNILDSYKETDT